VVEHTAARVIPPEKKREMEMRHRNMVPRVVRGSEAEIFAHLRRLAADFVLKRGGEGAGAVVLPTVIGGGRVSAQARYDAFPCGTYEARWRATKVPGVEEPT
jgi:hypothetical protein